jgi:hypothetical protein
MPPQAASNWGSVAAAAGAAKMRERAGKSRRGFGLEISGFAAAWP